MTLYTFYSCREDGVSTCLETRELPYDSAAFPVAGDILGEHPSASYVTVWDDERPVLSRFREAPTIRPAGDAGRPATWRPG
jgi:hypothetical protein